VKSVSFSLKAEPFSVNNVNKIGRGKLYYSKPYMRWREIVVRELDDPDKIAKMQEFHDNYDEKKHAISISLEFNIDSKKFYTTDGRVSMRSKDITNIEKPLVDLLFSTRFVERDDFINFNLDDKMIVMMTSIKKPNDRNFIKIKVDRVNKDKYYVNKK
jgi:hypothetical protein